MKLIASLCLFLVLPMIALAQAPVVTSTSPADNAVNVPTSTTTFSITFDSAVDTVSFNANGDGPSGGIMSSLDSLTGHYFSADHKTLYLVGKVSAGKPYFIMVFYAKRTGGSTLAVPYAFHFTTAASFPSVSVSGTVTGGTSGVSPAYAMVILNGGPITDKADFKAATVANASGVFSIPYVPNGTWYPVAAKSMSQAGRIDPSLGDPVGFIDPITVSGSNVTGMTIPLQGPYRPRYSQGIDSLNAHLASLPSPRSLRRIQGSGLDSTGAARRWQFDFVGNTMQGSFTFEVEQMGCRKDSMDPGTYNWMINVKPIVTPPTAVAVDSFLARTERGGGAAYRPQPMSWDGFDAQFEVGDAYHMSYYQLVSDTSKLYLGMNYVYYSEPTPGNWTMIKQRLFLGDYSTGNILRTSGVADQPKTGLPLQFELKQNYPNPFNPMTEVGFRIAEFGFVRLGVYDLLGREVAVLVNESKLPGEYTVSFDGGKLSSGVYLYRLTAGSFVQTKRMLLVR